MIYYDFDLDGEYQSTERALSFIHAMKEVLSAYDDTPNLAPLSASAFTILPVGVSNISASP